MTESIPWVLSTPVYFRIEFSVKYSGFFSSCRISSKSPMEVSVTNWERTSATCVINVGQYEHVCLEENDDHRWYDYGMWYCVIFRHATWQICSEISDDSAVTVLKIYHFHLPGRRLNPPSTGAGISFERLLTRLYDVTYMKTEILTFVLFWKACPLLWHRKCVPLNIAFIRVVPLRVLKVTDLSADAIEWTRDIVP